VSDSKSGMPKAAGMWRRQSSDFNNLKFGLSKIIDGEVYYLDESPEAISEARQEKTLQWFRDEWVKEGANGMKLAASLARCKEQRDNFLDVVELMIRRFEVEAPKSDDELFRQAWAAVYDCEKGF